jgi:hypothetical protein
MKARIKNWPYAAAVIGSLAAGTAAQAATLVTFNPSGAGLSTQGAFQADNYALSDFAIATIDNATGAFTETGTLRLNQFFSSSTPVFASATGLGNGTGADAYGLYITFTGTGTLPGFSPGSPPAPVNGTFSSISYSFLGDPGNTDTVSPTGILTDNGATDIVLATGSLAGGINAVSIGSSGVPSADVLLTLLQTSAGNLFFAAPPNIGFMEDSFTNTTSVFTFNNDGTTTTLNIDGGGGNGTFLTAVPEPASLLVMGCGLLGLGLIRRTSKQV